MEDKLVKINLWQEINDNIGDEEEFRNELLQSLQFEEEVKFQLNQLGKFIFENKKNPILNQISIDHSRNDDQHPDNLSSPKIEIKMFSGNLANWKAFIQLKCSFAKH